MELFLPQQVPGMDGFGLPLMCLLVSLTWAKEVPLKTGFGCFNTVLDIKCSQDELIVFDAASYGRNDTNIALQCNTMYQRNCEVDAHFTLNRMCSGLTTCALVVNTELFGDPCGYEEFLKVTYRCVSASTIHNSCQEPGAPDLFDHGLISSPNYPKKYYMDAECIWSLAVQPRQTIDVVIYDFELDVKRNGQCYDYLEIADSYGNTYFKDCGALGKQRLSINHDAAVVTFKTGHNGLTQRGFFIYFEAIGPGCPDIALQGNGSVMYHLDHVTGSLEAEITCFPGHRFSGTDGVSKTLLCQGSLWNDTVTPCTFHIPSTTLIPPTSPAITTLDAESSVPANLAKSGSIIGIALGVVSALLLITLLLVLTLYLHRRPKLVRGRNFWLFRPDNNEGEEDGEQRKKAERKLDEMRVVFNNLQENAINDESFHQAALENAYCKGSASNIRKAKKSKKKQNFRDDDMQGRNLLSISCMSDEDYDFMEHKDPGDTSIKYFEPEYARVYGSRRSSGSKPGKYALARSKESHLDSAYEWDENDIQGSPISQPPAVPPRRTRPMRTRSGVWDSKAEFRTSPPERMTPSISKKLITQSAPDLLAMIEDESLRAQIPCELKDICETSTMKRARMTRSSTLGAVHAHRTHRARSKSNSRINVRC